MNELNPELIQFLIIVGLMIISFSFEIVPMEVTALGALGLLLVFDIITIEESIAGFSNKAVITIGAIFIISKALVKTGFLEVLSNYLYRLGGNNKWITFFIFFITTSLISGFINNTAAVAIFIPLAFRLCQRFHISPTKILMPLSYAAIFGGTLTLIGTSTNLIVNSFLEDSMLEPFKMFEFAKLGSIFVIIGIFYNLLISRWFLPSRSIISSLTQKYHLSTYLTEFKLEESSKIIGKSINDLGIDSIYDFDIVKIIRNNVDLTISLSDVVIRRNDILLIQININDIINFKKDLGLLLLSDIKLSQNELTGNNHVLIEGLIPQNSTIIGKTLSQLNYRDTYNSFVLAIKRYSELLRDKVAHVKLKFSDTLLIMVPKDKIENLRRSNDLIILEELDIHLRYERYWWLSILIIPMIMFLASMQMLSITEGAILGSILLLVLRSISMEDVYEAINWPVIFLIALLIPIGTAMENTGAASYLSDYIINAVNNWEFSIEEQIAYVVSILYFITFVTSAFISNAAVAIILCPLAILLSNHFQSMDSMLLIDPTRTFLMAICFGASASFMTPIGYQTNLMVFAPGQYKFKDFMIAGLPITLIFWFIASHYIPIFWPFIK